MFDPLVTPCPPLSPKSLLSLSLFLSLFLSPACHKMGKGIHVWVDETRPRLQGARLSAWELMRDGVPMHLIADNAAGHLMRTGKVDIVLFGADRVAENGDVANKIGTYKVCLQIVRVKKHKRVRCQWDISCCASASGCCAGERHPCVCGGSHKVSWIRLLGRYALCGLTTYVPCA